MLLVLQEEQPLKKQRKSVGKAHGGMKVKQEEGSDQEVRDAAESLEAVQKAAHKARRAEVKVEKLAEREELRAHQEAQRRFDATAAWQEEIMLMEERGWVDCSTDMNHWSACTLSCVHDALLEIFTIEFSHSRALDKWNGDHSLSPTGTIPLLAMPRPVKLCVIPNVIICNDNGAG